MRLLIFQKSNKTRPRKIHDFKFRAQSLLLSGPCLRPFVWSRYSPPSQKILLISRLVVSCDFFFGASVVWLNCPQWIIIVELCGGFFCCEGYRQLLSLYRKVHNLHGVTGFLGAGFRQHEHHGFLCMPAPALP